MKLKHLDRNSTDIEQHPIRILQFGGGNFMRGFFDWIIDCYNQQADQSYGIQVVATTSQDGYAEWQKQDGLYHLLTRGIENGATIEKTQLIGSVSNIIHLEPDWSTYLELAKNPDIEFVVSNTTEAGIRFDQEDQISLLPEGSFPSNLTFWLYVRYRFFSGKADKGCVIMPLELIPQNGERLKEIVLDYIKLWNLEDDFRQWIEAHNYFCNTLVDRIVPGVAKHMLTTEQEKTGYRDSMLTAAEPFHFLAIEAPRQVSEQFTIDNIGLNIIYTDDLDRFRKRKVSILNGAHTFMVSIGILHGIKTVGEFVKDTKLFTVLSHFLEDEVICSFDLSKNELLEYKAQIMDRFRNPFIEHRLQSISLNSFSKFESRILPTITDYVSLHNKVPHLSMLALAGLVHLYRPRKDSIFQINDAEIIIDEVQKLWTLVDRKETAYDKLSKLVLQSDQLWDRDLSEIEGLEAILEYWLKRVEEDGMVHIISEETIRIENS